MIMYTAVYAILFKHTYSLLINTINNISTSRHVFKHRTFVKPSVNFSFEYYCTECVWLHV